MSARYLGNPFDIHAGGDDLIFPHHENEIAQSEACHNTAFANYWLHGGMLTIDREKMSKSEGNFLLLKDVLGQVRPQALRLLMLQTHYRSPFDYSAARLKEATAALDRIEGGLRNLAWAVEKYAAVPTPPNEVGDKAVSWTADLLARIERARTQFVESMDDDFNTASAVAALFELVTAGNSSVKDGIFGEAHRRAVIEARDTIVELLGALGVGLDEDGDAGDGDEPPAEVVALAAELAGYAGEIPAEAIAALLCVRNEARAKKDWGAADAVRDGLGRLGFVIEDTALGPRVVRR
jgi:cysteinyl-tRNA synthetase